MRDMSVRQSFMNLNLINDGIGVILWLSFIDDLHGVEFFCFYRLSFEDMGCGSLTKSTQNNETLS